MKKFTSNIYMLSLLLLGMVACRQKEKEPVKNQQEILQEITSVIGIGKVIPADGWIMISSPINGVIQETYVKEGDEVQEGQLILQLQAQTEAINVTQSEASLQTQMAQNKINIDNLQREKLVLTELESKYNTSLNLFEKKAETAEKLATDKNKWLQQQNTVAALQKQIHAENLKLKEQKLSIKKAKQQLNELQVLAPKSGTITELSADIGASISNTTAIGKIVNPESVMIEAEVDELIANKVKIGQQVTFHSVGRRDSIAKGVITYTSPVLSNKSILYESIGEGEDRRVRIIRIKPTHNLLINSKVECEINIK